MYKYVFRLQRFNFPIAFILRQICSIFTSGGETLSGAVCAYGTGDGLTVRTLRGTDVAGWTGQRAGETSGAPSGGATTGGGLAVEPGGAWSTLSLA